MNVCDRTYHNFRFVFILILALCTLATIFPSEDPPPPLCNMAATNPKRTLLTLPSEVRLKIYDALLNGQTPLTRLKKKQTIDRKEPLFLVCKQISNEYSPVFYHNANFAPNCYSIEVIMPADPTKASKLFIARHITLKQTWQLTTSAVERLRSFAGLEKLTMIGNAAQEDFGRYNKLRHAVTIDVSGWQMSADATWSKEEDAAALISVQAWLSLRPNKTWSPTLKKFMAARPDVQCKMLLRGWIRTPPINGEHLQTTIETTYGVSWDGQNQRHVFQYEGHALQKQRHFSV